MVTPLMSPVARFTFDHPACTVPLKSSSKTKKPRIRGFSSGGKKRVRFNQITYKVGIFVIEQVLFWAVCTLYSIRMLDGTTSQSYISSFLLCSVGLQLFYPVTQLYSKTTGSVSTSPILRLVTWYFSQSGKLLTPSRSTALQVRSSSVLLPCSGSLPAG